MTKTYLVHGEEALLCDEFLGSILPEDRTSVSRYDMRETNISEIIADASQVSLFGPEEKTIVLNDCYFLGSEKALNEKDQSRLTEFLNNKENTSILIFRYDKLDKRKKLVKELLKASHVFEGIPNRYPTKWLLDRSKRYGMKLASAAADKMVLNLGVNLYLLDSELKKLKNRYPNEAVITDGMLEDVLSRTIESDVFKLIEQVMYSKANAIDLLQDLLVTGNDEIAILLLLGRQLRMIEQIKIAAITKNPNPMKVHPYALQKASEQADYYRLDQIQSMLAEVVELDLNMKRGQVDKTIALETLILSWM